jgi:hypothetical protein
LYFSAQFLFVLHLLHSDLARKGTSAIDMNKKQAPTAASLSESCNELNQLIEAVFTAY